LVQLRTLGGPDQGSSLVASKTSMCVGKPRPKGTQKCNIQKKIRLAVGGGGGAALSGPSNCHTASICHRTLGDLPCPGPRVETLPPPTCCNVPAVGVVPGNGLVAFCPPPTVLQTYPGKQELKTIECGMKVSRGEIPPSSAAFNSHCSAPPFFFPHRYHSHLPLAICYAAPSASRLPSPRLETQCNQPPWPPI